MLGMPGVSNTRQLAAIARFSFSQTVLSFVSWAAVFFIVKWKNICMMKACQRSTFRIITYSKSTRLVSLEENSGVKSKKGSSLVINFSLSRAALCFLLHRASLFSIVLSLCQVISTYWPLLPLATSSPCSLLFVSTILPKVGFFFPLDRITCLYFSAVWTFYFWSTYHALFTFS